MGVVKTVTILGATGSIGLSTLDVLSQHPENFSVFALTAHRNIDALVALALKFKPRYIVLPTSFLADTARAQLMLHHSATEVLWGEAAMSSVCTDPEVEVVVAAIVGVAGLSPTLAAIRAGKRILLANKETLVSAGVLMMKAVHDHGAVLLPVDSEHNAIFQCLPEGQSNVSVRRIILTASGGALRDLPLENLCDVSVEQACTHPNWSMGKKITVDSSTLMNKGLEVIEASYLYHLPLNQIDVWLHPESIVHALVEYVDGSVLAQLSQPDMRVPIAHTLAYPERIPIQCRYLDLMGMNALHFSALNIERYPCYALANAALQAGGSAPAILNAANEIAVQAFLDHRIRFTEIPSVIEATLAATQASQITTLDDVFSVDEMARRTAENQVIFLQ